MNSAELLRSPSEAENALPQVEIPLCVPALNGNEWKYVKECLDTGWVSSIGRFVERFEEMVANYLGAKHTVATINGTAALHVALRVAGVRAEDEVLVPTLTFIAPVNAIRYLGAWPVFIDAEPHHLQMDADKTVDFLEGRCSFNRGELRNRLTGRRVKAILPVHILGHAVDIEPLVQVAREYDLVIVEDATESLGGKYQASMVGHLGDIACLSFNGNKIITTGGGGMIATDNQSWARTARYLTTQAKDDPVEYIHNEIGYNYRLSNMQAAVGCAQMEQLETCIAKKRFIAAAYTKALADVPGISPVREAEWADSSSWLYTVLVDPNEYGMDSRALMNSLANGHVQARPLWHPVHLLRPYRECQAYRIERAIDLYDRGLCLPSSVGLTGVEQARVIELILRCHESAKVSGS